MSKPPSWAVITPRKSEPSLKERRDKAGEWVTCTGTVQGFTAGWPVTPQLAALWRDPGSAETPGSTLLLLAPRLDPQTWVRVCFPH